MKIALYAQLLTLILLPAATVVSMSAMEKTKTLSLAELKQAKPQLFQIDRSTTLFFPKSGKYETMNTLHLNDLGLSTLKGIGAIKVRLKGEEVALKDVPDLHLELKNNQLAELPAEIGELTHLRSLDLENNKLQELPNELSQLKSLQALKLENNRFTLWPSLVEKIENLKSLFLSSNQIKEVPQSISNMKHLTDLWLMNNKLTSLPITELLKLPLEGINVSGNPFSENAKPAIIKFLDALQMKGVRRVFPERHAVYTDIYGTGTSRSVTFKREL